jgi:GAF domain-containing protein
LGDCIQFLKIAEREVQRSIFARVPVPELLNRICSALDCEIGNVVSLASVLDDVTTDFAAIAGNAKLFGLHMFCSMGLVSANRGPVGKLELYSCEPRIPTRRELDLIKRAAWLAAIAIESAGETLEDDDGAVTEMYPSQMRMRGCSEIVN